MSSNKIYYYEIGQDKDNPLFKIEYLEESKVFKKEDKSLSFGWEYQVGTVTNAKDKKLDYESRFSTFDASLEYLFDTIGNVLSMGYLGFSIETLSRMNFAMSQNTKVKTMDKEGHEIVFSIDSVGGVIPYNAKIESVDGKEFNGKLPEKIEEHICKFNNLNRVLKDIKRNPTYDKPKYFNGGLFEEMFELDKLISNETIEINNQVSKDTNISMFSEDLYESKYNIENYEITTKNYQNIFKKENDKILLGNTEQYQTIKRGNDILNFTNTFSAIKYDSKNLKEHGINIAEKKFLEKVTDTINKNCLKSLNFLLMSDAKTILEDKNGNTIETEFKLFCGNFLCSMKINKINGKEVTKLPKELIDIVNKYNKPLSGIEYYIDNKIEFNDVKEYSKATSFFRINYKRTIDSLFEIKDQLKNIDVTRKENLEYITDYKLKSENRIFKDIDIRTEKGMFTRVDKATFKSLDGHQIEIKVNSYLNGMYPTLRINSIDGIKSNVLIPMKMYLKDNSIDDLIYTAKNIIEKNNFLEKKDILTDKEKDKLLAISEKEMNNAVSNIVDIIPNENLKDILKKIVKKATKNLNEHMLLNMNSENIREIKIDGRLTKEMIQSLYNQNPNLETIINNNKKINVMDYINETLDDKINREQMDFIKDNNNKFHQNIEIEK